MYACLRCDFVGVGKVVRIAGRGSLGVGDEEMIVVDDGQGAWDTSRPGCNRASCMACGIDDADGVHIAEADESVSPSGERAMAVGVTPGRSRAMSGRRRIVLTTWLAAVSMTEIGVAKGIGDKKPLLVM